MKITYVRSSSIFDESRASKEILAFLEAGYDVEIVGWDRKGNAETNCRQVFEEYDDRLEYHFFDGQAGTSFIERIICRIKWGKWLSTTLKSISDSSIIHACDYDTGAIVRRFSTRSHIPYVYDIFDYYIDAHPIPILLKFIVERDEIKVINSAATCIICTIERKEQISKANPKRLLVIYNSPDISSIDSNYGNEPYDYIYCGGLYRYRLVEEILDEYHNHNNLSFVVAGTGEYEYKTKKLSQTYGKFVFLNSIPYDNVLKLEAKSKVISAIYDPSFRNHRLCAPNKFYEALALGKPLIVCRGTGIDKIVIEHNIGCVISYDADEFYDALDYLIKDEKLREDMGKRARKLYEDQYQWKKMKKRLIEEYEAVISLQKK